MAPHGHPGAKVCLSICAALVVVVASTRSPAANLAADNAADNAYNTGWVTGTNGGSGFAPWSITNANPGDMGVVIRSSATNGAAPPSGNIDVAGKSFGLYSHVPDFIIASRKLTGGSLAVGSTSHFTGALTGITGSGIDTIQFLNDDAGLSPSHDAFINNLAVTPEPAALAFVPLAPALLIRRRPRRARATTSSPKPPLP
jgi:hypothetical protein